MFFSTYENALDAKGRISVPASFRAAIGGEQEIYVYPATDGSGFLEAGGSALIRKNQKLIRRMNPQSGAGRAFQHAFFTRSARPKMDDAGRIKLPEMLLEAAGIKKDVVFAGADDRFRIWSAETFAAHDEQMVEDAANHQDAFDKAFNELIASGELDDEAAA